MGSPSSPGNNHAKALITGFLSEIHHFKWRAVSRKHPDLHLHTHIPQDCCGRLHGGQVGIAAHHQGHTGKHCRHSQ